MFTVADARRYAVSLFAQSPLFKACPRSALALDADVLLQHFLAKPRAWLFAHSGADISAIRTAFCAAVERRCTGLPIAYITGEKEFWGLPFYVTPAVLIPKPDTELLVEWSLAVIREKAAGRPEKELYLLDPCTGSGCVAVSILHTLYAEHIRNVRCLAADISPASLAVARINAERLLPPEAQAQLLFLEKDMRALSELTGQLRKIGFFSSPCASDGMSCRPKNGHSESCGFDLIAANPPYVPSALTQELLTDGRNEPALALDGGADGLDFIRILTNNAGNVLNGQGVLLSEVGEYHAKTALRLFEQAGFQNVRMHRDLAGQDRLIEGEKCTR